MAVERNFLAEVLLLASTCLLRFVARGLLAHFTSTCKSPERQDEVVLGVHSMYKDLTASLASCLARIGSQTMCVVYIFMYIGQHKEHPRSTLFWASTLPLQLLASKSMGSRFCDRSSTGYPLRQGTTCGYACSSR
ncbi:unnamed protein product [Polarella glacialis]|uniref:Uncharacterized protein n=1 Tax=Polarella glacialis TaxID=89957 RepID=A0A813HGM7_POLGL|nr:unnamed protein product [Polarella glacialis]